MSVKISNKQRLDSNAYNKIVIREVDGDFFIRVTGKKSTDEYISISYKLTDRLKNLRDYEKIIMIVDSFLENADVNIIQSNSGSYGYTGNFIKIAGSRELYLQISDSVLLNELIKMVLNKYDRDRYKYCIGFSDIKSYSIVLDRCNASYSKKLISCDKCDYHGDCEGLNLDCPGYIQFKVMYINGKMMDLDEKFIQRFVYDKLWEIGVRANIVKNMGDIKLIDGTVVNSIINSYSIVCGDLVIMFNCSVSTRRYMLDICNSIVNKYNNELIRCESVKKRQLKMEGF